MIKQFKRFISLTLVLLLLLGANLSAFAREPASLEEGMERALLAVRNLIEIDDSVYTEFHFSSDYRNWETMEGLFWMFQWRDERGDSFISATAEPDGTLMNFWTWRADQRRFGFAEISQAEAIAAGNDFLRRANPTMYSYFLNTGNVFLNIHDNNIFIVYNAVINGHSFDAASISIQVDKFSGEVTGYSSSMIDPRRFTFSDSENLISERDAIAAHAEHIGLSLEYRSFFNWDDETLAVFPVYVFNNQNFSFISATTGEVVNFVFDTGERRELGLIAEQDAAMAPAQNVGGFFTRQDLSPAEIAAIERVGGFITSEQALERLLYVAGLQESDIEHLGVRNITLRRDLIDRDRYFYDVMMWRQHSGTGGNDSPIDSLFGTVDAESGRVVSFHFSYDWMFLLEFDEFVYSEAQAEAAIEEFLRSNAPDEFALTRLDSSSHPAVDFAFHWGWGMEHSFNYVRIVNGIPFRENGINISFNPFSGQITSFNLSWFENVTFRSIDNVLSQYEALSAFTAQNGSELRYITVGGARAELVYSFIPSSWWGFIDPFTGNAVDFRGETVEDLAAAPVNENFRGHWSERYLTRLIDNGVHLWDAQAEPDSTLTQQEFVRALSLVQPWSINPPHPAMFTNINDIDINPNATLTRMEAVRIIVELLGYSRLAENYEWFVFPFADDIAEEYRGFVTIAFMMGIIGGEVGGSFGGARNATTAQATVMIHNFVLSLS